MSKSRLTEAAVAFVFLIGLVALAAVAPVATGSGVVLGFLIALATPVTEPGGHGGKKA